MAKEESTIIFVSKDKSYIKEYKISRNKFLLYSIIFLVVFMVGGNYSLDWLLEFRYDSKVEFLEKNNQFLKSQLGDMGDKIELINGQLTIIEDRDDEIRMIMGIKELGDDVRDVGIGGTNFEYKFADQIVNPDVADDLNKQMLLIDKLEREVKLELQSFGDLINTYHAKEDSIRHMPALHPVVDGRITSDFGMRLHPIFKRYRKHPGIDFAAKAGSPIYAAADGIIKLAKYNGGYGNCVIIDHLYGFESRYGHMQKILVRRGQRVERGDKIGLVGKTGIATAPHLHFEVHYKGKEVNPRHYFFDDPSLNRLVVEENRR
ncbi:MAG: M23 family metallopeptidase [Calditrichia bacterium]|nr:M23 family metallopeptidase [Calditrichia bacterium]